MVRSLCIIHSVGGNWNQVIPYSDKDSHTTRETQTEPFLSSLSRTSSWINISCWSWNDALVKQSRWQVCCSRTNKWLFTQKPNLLCTIVVSTDTCLLFMVFKPYWILPWFLPLEGMDYSDFCLDSYLGPWGVSWFLLAMVQHIKWLNPLVKRL